MTMTNKHQIKRSKIDLNKSEECMVCGKMFHRGIIDLARHQTAITLQHLSSSEQSATCQLQCERCGIYFSNEEHIEMHQSQSSCSKKDDNIQSKSENPTEDEEFMVIESIEFEEHQERNNATDYHQKDGNQPEEIGYNADEGERSDIIKIEKIATPVMNSSSSLINISASTATSVSSEDIQNRMLKKGKVILPMERKAFFAIISLLVDPKLMSPSTQLTSENFIEYIPAERQPLVEIMKEYLLYDCY